VTVAKAFSKFRQLEHLELPVVAGSAALALSTHRPRQMINMPKAQLNERYGIIEHGCKCETLAAWTGQLYRTLSVPFYGKGVIFRAYFGYGSGRTWWRRRTS
jgi:hypothetical protein